MFILGNKQAWNASRDNSSFPKKFKKINLWIDSSDFTLTGRRKISKRCYEWSYKEDAPIPHYSMKIKKKILFKMFIEIK